MTREFKTGDKVVCIETSDVSGDFGRVGDTAVVFAGPYGEHDSTMMVRFDNRVGEPATTKTVYAKRFKLHQEPASFKTGDRVRYIGPGMAAKTGAKGTVGSKVYESFGSTQYLQIIWDKNDPLVGGQRDGGYWPSEFVKIEGEEAARFIVVRVKNGLWEPALNPKVHVSREAAETEANRLATKGHGYSFVVLEVGKAFKADIVINVKEVTV
jgi:hypothetical protein